MKVTEGYLFFFVLSLSFRMVYIILTLYGWTSGLYHILFLGELMG